MDHEQEAPFVFHVLARFIPATGTGAKPFAQAQAQAQAQLGESDTLSQHSGFQEWNTQSSTFKCHGQSTLGPAPLQGASLGNYSELMEQNLFDCNKRHVSMKMASKYEKNNI